MKIHFADMNKTEQWIICSIDYELVSKFLEHNTEEGMDISLTINGIDIPFDKMVKRIDESFDYNVALEVKRITGINETLLSKVESLKELSNKLSEIVDNLE